MFKRLKRGLGFIGIVIVSTMVGQSSVFASEYLTREEMFTSLREAKINWRQCSGEQITFIGNREPNQEAIMELIPIFEELTGIKVAWELISEEHMREKTTIDIKTETGSYDALLIDPSYIPLFTKAEGIENLNVYLNNSTLTDLNWYNWPNDFPAGFREMGQRNSVQYGIPLHLSGTLMFYRKDIFQKYGIGNPPGTMDELWKYAGKLHNPKEDLYGITMRGLRGSGMNIFIWSCFLKSFGGRWFDEDWKPLLNSPESIKSVEFYADVLRNYGPPGILTFDWAKVLATMQRGKVALVIDTPAFAMPLNDPEKSITVGLWGYASQPAGPAGPCMDPYSWYVGLNKYSKHKKAAWLFVLWMTSRETQTAIGGAALYTSRLSATTDPRWQKYYPWIKEWQEALMENSKYADPNCRPMIPEFPEIGDTLGAALSSVLAGEKIAKPAFDEACARIYEVMRKAGYYK